MELENNVNFDDNDNELNEILIRTFSTIFGVKGSVVNLTKDQWIDLLEGPLTKTQKQKVSNDMDYIFGQCNTESKVIYINPRLCKRQWSTLVSTIIHEILHIRFPDDSEEKIMTMERLSIGRFDSVTLSNKEEKCHGTRK